MRRMLLTGNAASMHGAVGKPLVVILGATATGKTGLAIELAKALDGEVVSADSRQVYRYMDIGTAKPTPAERQEAVHHLIDYVDPAKNLTLAAYQRDAYTAIDSLHTRGKLPLLVGGTGQYITAVVEGWSIPSVPPNHELRADLELQAATGGPNALHARLAVYDPDYAARIHPNNVRRVVRALEICLTTGSTVTALQQKHPPPYRVYTLGLHMERDALYARADARVDHMVTVGLVDEVRGLLERGYDPQLPSMSAVGYREIVAHLIQGRPLDDCVQEIKHNTHDFIRRQEVWFRGHDHGILWHNVGNLNIDIILSELRQWLQEH